jgi:DNA-binding GntR family transcriptional regulator
MTLTNLRPVNLSESTPSLTDAVYHQLRAMLGSGQLKPGDALRQEPLAQMLGVSRVPLREALRRLEAEGLVGLRDRRGYSVIALDREEIEEVFRIRIDVEGRAGFLATERRTEENVAEVKTYLELLDRIDLKSDPDVIATWASYNRMFHNALLAPCGNRPLLRVLNTLRDQVEHYVRVEVPMTGNVKEAQREHRKLFALYRKGDAEAVAELSREHCRNSAKRLLSKLA